MIDPAAVDQDLNTYAHWLRDMLQWGWGTGVGDSFVSAALGYD